MGRKWMSLSAAALSLALAGCQTTQQAAVQMQSRWIGQPADSFFTQHGPPISSFALSDGGMLYTWRGGQASYTRPAQVRTVPMGGAQRTSSRTTTTTMNPAPGSTITRSRTVSTSFGVTPTVTTVVRPAQQVEILCEAQIAAGPDGTIRNIRISRDTQGAGFSFSRCGEIFNR